LENLNTRRRGKEGKPKAVQTATTSKKGERGTRTEVKGGRDVNLGRHRSWKNKGGRRKD